MKVTSCILVVKFVTRVSRSPPPCEILIACEEEADSKLVSCATTLSTIKKT